MKHLLFLALGICSVVFVAMWAVEVRRSRSASWPSLRDCGIGLLTLFLDTLGIGAFATTTAFFKLWHLVADEDIPGTLNIGITLPAVAEGLIYMSVVDVDVKTLTLMIAAAATGAWFGAGIVSRWPRRKIQIGMGITLLVTAGFVLMTQFHMLPVGGDLLVMVNGMGGTPLIELYLMFNEVRKYLEASGARVARSLVGNYITSLEMQGFSVTVCRLSGTLEQLWDAPVDTPALRWGR